MALSSTLAKASRYRSSLCDIQDGKLFLFTQKSGAPVFCPLPDFVTTVLDEVRCPNSEYFFWTGESKHHSVVGNWQRSYRKLFEIAGFTKKERAHPHRFRHTVAVESLLSGIPLERVSVLLGHSSVKITEKYYAAWVKGRQELLEADVRRSWTDYPLAQEFCDKSATDRRRKM